MGTKISALTAATDVLDTDRFVLARGGSNRYVTPQILAAYFGLIAAGTVTSVAGRTGAVTLAASDLTNGVDGSGKVVLAAGTTGTGNVVRVTSPTLVTPVLGAAAATSIVADTFTTTAANVITDATTARTIVNGDNGKTIKFTSASAVTVSLNTGLTAGFSCNIIQAGAGQVTVGGTATVNARNGKKTAGQHAPASILYGGATDTYWMGGDTST